MFVYILMISTVNIRVDFNERGRFTKKSKAICYVIDIVNLIDILCFELQHI